MSPHHGVLLIKRWQYIPIHIVTSTPFSSNWFVELVGFHVVSYWFTLLLPLWTKKHAMFLLCFILIKRIHWQRFTSLIRHKLNPDPPLHSSIQDTLPDPSQQTKRCNPCYDTLLCIVCIHLCYPGCWVMIITVEIGQIPEIDTKTTDYLNNLKSKQAVMK